MPFVISHYPPGKVKTHYNRHEIYTYSAQEREQADGINTLLLELR